MRVGKTRIEIEEELIKETLQIKRKRNVVNNIKKNLFAHNKVEEGVTQGWINDPAKKLPTVEWELLFLFAEQVYLQTKNEKINPNVYYTKIEAKNAKTFVRDSSVKTDINLPLILKDALEVGYNSYSVKIDAKTLAQMSSTLLNYNFEIQREPEKFIRGNETFEKAVLVMENVEEIKDHLISGTLVNTMLVINAKVGTADEGNELYYNEETRELMINKGAILDIVDGYHRCKGTELAISEKPDIDFNFVVLITNSTDNEAKQYQAQFAKQTPINKMRQQQLESSRHADAVVTRLLNESELKNRVSTNIRTSVRVGELVSYGVLSDVIDEQFNFDRQIDVYKIGDYLVEYFNILMGTYEEEFIINPAKTRRKSLINENNMFIGYIVLARRMYEQGIPAREVIKYVGGIDFSRESPLWSEKKITTKGVSNRTSVFRKEIRKIFEKIDL